MATGRVGSLVEDSRMARAVFSLALTLLAVVTAAAALGQVAGDDAKAAALLAKHRAYVGWQFGDGTLRSMRITGDVTNEKGERTISFVSLSRGLLVHDTYTMIAHGNVT